MSKLGTSESLRGLGWATLGLVELGTAGRGWALLGTPDRVCNFGFGHARENLGLGTPAISELGTPRKTGVGHCRETLRLGTPGVSAAGGHSRVGHSRESGVGHLREFLELGTPGSLLE